jgi:hypothetical protein
MPPADLSYPVRLPLKRGFVRDLYCDLQAFAELVPATGTSQAGETGEGQTLVSGTATLTAEDPVNPSVPITLNSSTCTVSGTKLVATVTVPATATAATYSILWIGVTNQARQVSATILYDVKVP